MVRGKLEEQCPLAMAQVKLAEQWDTDIAVNRSMAVCIMDIITESITIGTNIAKSHGKAGAFSAGFFVDIIIDTYHC